MGARHHRVGGGNRASDAAHHRFPGAWRHRGIAVEIDQAARRRDMAEFADIMLVVTERDQIEIAFRRLAAHQRLLKRSSPSTSADRAQPVGALGMSRRRGVVEARRMREKERRHARSWRVEARFSRRESAANLRGHRRPLRKEPDAARPAGRELAASLASSIARCDRPRWVRSGCGPGNRRRAHRRQRRRIAARCLPSAR